MEVRFDSGEEARATAVDGNVLTLLSARAFAPGSPIRFSLALDGEWRRFEGRTIGSKRADNSQFEVRLRLVNLRRAERELLLRELA